jgi:hypothetical protein
MPKVALLSRVKAKEGTGGELSDAMTRASPALAELIAEAEFRTGEPVSAKGLPA